jgi:hypothetical protein
MTIPMELETLCQELYEDLNGRITAVEFGDALTLRAECEHWDEAQGRLRFELCCEGVEDFKLVGARLGWVHWEEQHPLLLAYHEPRESLYFSSRPADVSRAVMALAEAHAKVYGRWRWAVPFGAPGFQKLFAGGNGCVTVGPKTLIDAYAAALQDHCELSRVHDSGPIKLDTRILVLEENYVICRKVALKVADPKEVQSGL